MPDSTHPSELADVRPAHHVSETDFAALASGYGDAGLIDRLRAARLSKTLLCLRELLDAAPVNTTDLTRAGLFALAEIQRSRPDVVAETLSHPLVGAWAMHALRVLRGARASDLLPETHYGQLSAIAVAAAVRAGLPIELDVPVRDGFVLLPSLGRLRVGTAAHRVRVVCSCDQVVVDGRLLPSDLSAEDAAWQPVRRFRLDVDDLPLAVQLDDLDTYRDCEGEGAAGRLTPESVSRWREQLLDAWTILVRQYPQYASPIARGLVSLVPLAATQRNRGVSATTRDAFGAVLVGPSPDPRWLALTLVHEFQHGKLWTLLDLVQLHEPDPVPRYYAPWRNDPRPLRGLLHGAYAFLGVTDFWRAQRTLPGNRVFANYEFARWRERVSRVLDVLAGSERLTAAGHHFLAGMRTTLTGWLEQRVPPASRQLARDATDDHQTAWRIRNQRPDPVAVDLFVKAWRAGDRPPPGAGSVETVPSEAVFKQSARLDLAGLRINEPARFAAMLADPAALHRVVPHATDADLAFASGNYPGAIAAYRVAIAAEPGDADHWAGLTVALRRLGTSPATTALLSRPDLVAAVYRALADRPAPPPPDQLADWLSGSLSGIPTV